MRYRIKIAKSDLDQLRGLVTAEHAREGAAFALAGVADLDSVTDVLVRRAVQIPNAAFTLREVDHLQVDSSAVNGLISLCEANGLGAVLCHSHPASVPYSSTDDEGERRVARVLHDCLAAPAPVASLLFSPTGIEGRVWPRVSGQSIPVSEIVVLADHIERHARDSGAILPDPIYDRQIRAFGEEGQARIINAKVAVVGTGGTGSSVAEQLVRLGIRDLLLIDPDDCDPSNLTRMYGTFPDADQRDPVKKVELISRHLSQINPRATLRTFVQNVAQDEAARELRDRDCVFLCTDDHWGRSVVNQLAYQYLVPVINVGVGLAGKGGRIEGATGAIDVLGPDLPCLWCKRFLNPARIAHESMPSKDRTALQREGYVEGLDTPEPAVISITTTVAGHAVTMFLHLVTGFMGEDGDVQSLRWDILRATVSRGRTSRDDRCICRKVRGFGDLATRPTLSTDAGY